MLAVTVILWGFPEIMDSSGQTCLVPISASASARLRPALINPHPEAQTPSSVLLAVLNEMAKELKAAARGAELDMFTRSGAEFLCCV